jgi:hypothetical protein
MASAFPPWRLVTTLLIHGPGGQFLAGFALVVGGFVGLAIAGPRAEHPSAVVGCNETVSLNLEPTPGFEPGTFSLPRKCSTA